MSGDPLYDVALKLTDGSPVDWEAAARAAPPADQAAVAQLRALQALNLVHTSHGDEKLVFDSIRHAPDVDADTPVRWGSLELLGKIGSGAYGDVYRARDPRLGREVALKLLRHRDVEAGESAIVREGHLLARVRHPNVVTVYGAERIGGRTGLWMELVSGETLEQELQRGGRFSPEDVRRIAVDLCGALEAVHAAGLLHRDIKAQNVVRGEDGRIVLMDFGTGTEDGVAAVGRLAGTPAYLAPEVLNGSPPSVASEIYAIGVLLFRLLTAEFPVSGPDVAALQRALRGQRRPSVATLRPDVPKALSHAVDRALAHHPASRFDSVAAFRASLLQPRKRRVEAGRVAAAASLVAAALLTVAVLFNRDGLAPSAGITLMEIPASLQQKVQIRAASWGGLATCSAVGRGTVSLCDLRDGEVRHVRNASSRGRATQAFLSPDGRRVAYTWFEDLKPQSFRVVESTGTDDREILRAGDDPTSLAGWNRGGTKVLLRASSQDGTCAQALDVDSGSRERLHCLTAASLGDFSLSADERYLAYTRSPASGGEPADLWVLDRRSGTHRELTNDAALDTDVSWTPDGRHVAFASNRLGTWGIFTIEVEQGAVRGSPRLIRDLGRSRPSLLGFTRQGTLLLRMMTELEDIVRTQPDYAAESLGIPSRAEPSALDESNHSPDWSPDSKRFAFIAGEWRGDARIVIARLSGGIERSWTFPGERSRFRVLRWSPDGTTLAVSVGSGDPNGSTLELIDVSQGRRREILNAGRITDLRWAPDGRGIYYLSQNGIHYVDVGTGGIRLVYRPTPPWTLEGTSTFDLSRDGTALVLAVTSAGVRCVARVVDVLKRTHDLGPLPGPCRAVAWSHDEQAVLAAVHTPDGIPVFLVGAVGNGPPIRLQSPQIQVVDISASPDGSSLLLGSGNPRPDVWTLSGFAPGR